MLPLCAVQMTLNKNFHSFLHEVSNYKTDRSTKWTETKWRRKSHIIIDCWPHKHYRDSQEWALANKLILKRQQRVSISCVCVWNKNRVAVNKNNHVKLAETLFISAGGFPLIPHSHQTMSFSLCKSFHCSFWVLSLACFYSLWPRYIIRSDS